MDKVRILVVEDEETLCEVLKFNLEAEGYSVDTACTAEEALGLRLASYDIVLLDIMMGKISGLELARRMKADAATTSIPIIFTTARADEADVIEGLDLGADDYVTKPYTVGIILARVRTVLRRIGRQESAAMLVSEGIVLNVNEKSCTIDGHPVKLARKEFEILRMLLTNKNRVLSRSEILAEVWPDDVVVVARVVDVNITRLRNKLGPYGHRLITRTGYGYEWIG